MTIHYRKITFFICSIILLVSIFLVYEEMKISSRNNEQVNFNYSDENELIEIPEDHFVDDKFYSHLPLVVIDTNGNEFIDNKVYNPETKGYDNINDPDLAFIDIEISIYDKDDGNKLSDKPTITSNAKIKYRGNSSYHRDKHQYLIKFVNKKGKSKDVDVMGMGSDSTWVLNGSIIDKSLMRNSLGYEIASNIMDAYVDYKYCEVFNKNGNNYEYMGVFLMIESIKHGKNRIPIVDYRNKYAESGYLVKRDRYDKWELTLNNYAYENHLNYGALTLKYPLQEDITKETIQYIEDDISNFERALYSNDAEEFIKYRNYINLQSFVDYFIINELLGNYDAGNNSTYFYKQLGGKISMGPVWDFDGAMDNYNQKPFDYDAMAFQESPWYNRLLLDPYFCELIIERYQKLRKNILSNQSIINKIDNNMKYLGKAQKREWSRWGYFYIDKDYLVDSVNMYNELITDRNLKTYNDEINKLKTVITNHANWLDENIDSIYMKINTVEGLESEKIQIIDENNNIDINYGAIFAIIFVIVFIISIVLIQRD